MQAFPNATYQQQALPNGHGMQQQQQHNAQVRAEPEEERELHARLKQLLRECKHLPASIAEGYNSRVKKLQTLVEATLKAGTLDTSSVQQLIVAVETVKEEVHRTIARHQPKQVPAAAKESFNPFKEPTSSAGQPAAPSKDVLDGLIISGVCRVGGVLELKHVSGEPLSQELQVVWHKITAEGAVNRMRNETGFSVELTEEEMNCTPRALVAEKEDGVVGRIVCVDMTKKVLNQRRPSLAEVEIEQSMGAITSYMSMDSDNDHHRDELLHMLSSSTGLDAKQGAKSLTRSVTRRKNSAELWVAAVTKGRTMLAVSSTMRAHTKARRKAISSEPSNQAGKNLEELKLTKVYKSTATRQTLHVAMMQHFLFTQLPSADMENMISYMFKVEKKKLETVVKKGDDADNFYVIEWGTCRVVIDDPLSPDGEKEVCKLGHGDSFGEMALMYNSKRAATVKAVTDMVLWALDMQTFNAVLQSMGTSTTQFLRHVDLLKPLTDDELEQMASKCKETVAADGEHVIREGDTDKDIYIIKHGTIKVMGSGPDKAKVKVQLSTSTVLGVDSLINGSARNADCVADGEVHVLRIPADVFRVYLPKLQAIMYEDNLKVEALKAAMKLDKLAPADIAEELKLFEKVTLNQGEMVCKAGQRADAFYVIATGTVEVVDPQGSTLGYMGVRQSIGGRSLTQGIPHVASVRVHSPQATLLKILAETFYKVRGDLAIQKRLKLLQGVSSFKALKGHQMEDLARALKVQKFSPGEVVVNKGELGDSFYLIQSGEASVHLPDGSAKSLYTGDHFGERAFLATNTLRSASVFAVTNLECLVTDRNTFERLLGNLGVYVSQLDNLSQNMKMNLDDLIVIKSIGMGQFGRVRLVKSKRTGHSFAMKCLEKRRILELGQTTHIKNEKLCLEQIDHPFIVRLVTTCKDARCVYMVLELCLGGELFTILNNQPGGRFDEPAARFYTACVVSALDHIHGQGMCYRDLKPENLLLDKDGYLKVTDFGFAKVLGEEGTTYTLCGTADYLAPELIMHKGHGKEVDLWALGVLIYELLCGCTPFAAKDENDPNYTYKSILEDTVYYPKFLSKDVVNLISLLLMKDDRKRLGSGIGGMKEVKAHPWFKDMDWTALIKKQLKVPFHPVVKSPEDTSNFEDIEEDDGDMEIDQVSTNLLDDVF